MDQSTTQAATAKNNLLQQNHVFKWAFASCLIFWCALPPLGIWIAGWVALAPLTTLVYPKTLGGVGRQPGKRPYFKMWIACLLFWLGTFYFIPFPHPALWAGWAVVSAYLAIYLPLVVAAARGLYHLGRIPMFLSLPIAWTGFELVRCYAFTGMGLVCLSHTQYTIPEIIQVADLSGAYGLTFLMAIVATCFGMILYKFKSSKAQAMAHVLPIALVAGAVWWYGQLKLNEPIEEDKNTSLKIALIQGSIDATLPKSLDEQEEHRISLVEEYTNLTQGALAQWEDTDLVIWPEGSWPQKDLLPETDSSRLLPEQIETIGQNHNYYLSAAVGRSTVFPQFLVGGLSLDPVADVKCGSALHFDATGIVVDRYHKNHLVMFGEYVPLAGYLRPLKEIPALGKGLRPGTESITMKSKGVKIAPNICFESTVPHYMRQQINSLEESGDEPDAMVNLTNDGWFYGSTCLDFHLACNVFRAVELRKPNIVCANTGFSAEIDDRGRILQQGPRRATAVLRAVVHPRKTESTYREFGDAIPISMAALSCFFLLVSWIARFVTSSSKTA